MGDRRHVLVPQHGVIDRPRLLARLRRRFDVPVTALVAGAGFGKSVLLRQALLDNQQAPRGVDCWVPLGRADARATSLVESIGRAAGVHLDPAEPAGIGAGLVDRLGPGACLVLDDVHRVPDDSAGGHVLAELVETLPSGLTVLVAGRGAPAVVARRHAIGAVEWLDEAALAFDEDEVAALLGHDAGAILPDDVGGWPAMVALRSRLGGRDAERFVVEEVLADLDPEDREALAVLSQLGPVDGRTAAAALGRPVDLSSLVSLPLVYGGSDRFEPHALWSELLGSMVDPALLDDARRRLAATLLDRGEVVRAGDEFVALRDDDGLRAAARATCAAGFMRTPADVLAGWWAAMGEGGRSSVEGRLLAALVRRSSDPFSEDTRAALQAALAAAREQGDVGLEVAVLWEYGYVCRARGELLLLLAEIPRAKELAATTDLAVPLASLADALVADATGDLELAESVLASIDRTRVPPGWRAPVEFMAMWCAYGRGDAEALRRCAHAFVDAAPEDFAGRPFVAPWVDWLGGSVPKDLADLPRPGEQAGSTDADRLWSGASFGIMWAGAGLRDLADEAVTLSVSAARSAFLPQHRATAVAASAALAVADGDDEGARTLLSDLLDEPGVDLALVERSLRSVMVIALVLEPRLRAWWRANPPGPLFDAPMALGEAVLDARAGGAAMPAQSALSHLCTSVPLRWAAQLVCRWQRHEPRVARRALEQLAADHGERVRSELRAIVEAGGPDSTAARKLLSTVGFRSAPVAFQVLGPTGLSIGGRPCDGEDWRRERVRALASLLAHRRRIRRDVAADLLWPDLDPDAARRNLRVTLNYLQRLLEPDRLPNEAPFYLHQHDDWLELLEAPHVVVDAEVLDGELAEADRCRDQGALRSALETYRSALSARPGPLLEEFADHEWASLDAARGRTRLVAAHVSWSSLELAFGEPDRATDAALAAVGLDPYSEAARRAVVSAQLAAGDRSAARRSLSSCLDMLAELGVGPSEPTEVLIRRLGD